jgi:hypothetical protein
MNIITVVWLWWAIGVHATRKIEGIGINILAVLRGHSKLGRNRCLYEILILFIMVNTGNVVVSWSGLFESGLEWTVWEWAGVDCLRVDCLRVDCLRVDCLRVDCLRVGWSGLFESGLQQKWFQNFHFLLKKTRYIKVYFFRFLVTFSILFGGIWNKI